MCIRAAPTGARRLTTDPPMHARASLRAFGPAVCARRICRSTSARAERAGDAVDVDGGRVAVVAFTERAKVRSIGPGPWSSTLRAAGARHTGPRDASEVERSVARSARSVRTGRLERRNTRYARLRHASLRGSCGGVRDSLGAPGPRSCPRSTLRAAPPRGNDHDCGFDRLATWGVRLGGRVRGRSGGPAARSRGAVSRRRRDPLAESAGSSAGLTLPGHVLLLVSQLSPPALSGRSARPSDQSGIEPAGLRRRGSLVLGADRDPA